jgi:hypothetical protein
LKRLSSLFALSAVLVVACAAFGQAPRGRFVVLPPHGNQADVPAGSLAEWNGSFKYQSQNYNFVMVGSDPSKTNTTTTVTVYLIPVNICITVNGTKTCFDPKTKQPNGQTAIQDVQASPIFTSSIDYNQTGTDIGTTQYEDAFQRANFWTSVMTNTKYHVLLKLVTLPEVTVQAPGSIANEFGVTAGLVDINYIDSQILAGLPKLKQVNPTNLPLVMLYNVYLTEGSCCIGGYHSANGAQSYSEFTYAYAQSGTPFSADVSALSHEVGEWMDDPLTNNGGNGNPSPCGIYEVGDPIEREVGTHDFGDYTYSLNGMTYHVQDLATPTYFGYAGQSNDNNFTFQGQNGVLPGEGQISVCSFGA